MPVVTPLPLVWPPLAPGPTLCHIASVYFKPDRRTSSKELLICAGFGRTGTETLNSIVSGSHLGIHEKKPVTLLPSLDDDAFSTILTRFSEDKVALLDNPVGLFTWELMDAFPNHFVILTLRHVRQSDSQLPLAISRFVDHSPAYTLRGCNHGCRDEAARSKSMIEWSLVGSMAGGRLAQQHPEPAASAGRVAGL